MANVPSHSRTRRTHRTSVAPSRRTHRTSGYEPSLEGAAEVYEQIVVDGVVLPGDIPPGSVDGNAIVPYTLPVTSFASTIMPPEVVGALPTLPNVLYPIGRLVFLTTDGKLYRNVANAWVKSVDGADILADSITAGQIAAAAIGADEIAAQAIDVVHLRVGVFGNLVVNGSFEEALGAAHTSYVSDSSLLPGWTISNCLARFGTSANAKTGLYIATIQQSGAEPKIYQVIPVVAGRTYRLAGWVWKGAAGGAQARLRANTLDAAKVTVAFNAINLGNTTGTTATRYEGTYTVPSDGSVSYLRIDCMMVGTPAVGEVAAFEDVELVPVASTTLIEDGAITTAKVAANAITANEIAADAVTATEIAAGAVTADHIAANAITIAAQARKGANLLDDSSFEIAPDCGFGVNFANTTDPAPYWTGTVGLVGYYTSVTSRTGTHVLRITGNGTSSFPVLISPYIPVQPGRRYRMSGWMTKTAGTQSARMALPTYDDAKVVVSNPAVSINDATNRSSLVHNEVYWTCPSDGTVSYVRVQCMISNTPTATDVALFEDVCFEEVPAGLRNTPGDVVITEAGVTITNGALTVQNPGSTVIIDGSSNMFKISNSGTTSALWPAVGAVATQTLVSFGAASAIPAFLAIVSRSTSTGDYREPGKWQTHDASGNLSHETFGTMLISGGTLYYDHFAWCPLSKPAGSAASRYYVLVEAGI